MKFDATLNLDLPQLTKQTSKTFDFRPKAIKKWLSECPFSDVTKTADIIINTLRLINRTPATIKQRAILLYTVTDTLHSVARQHENLYTNVGLPLAEQHQKQAIIVHTLYTEMAIGYKRIIDDIIHGKAKRLPARTLAAIIHDAIYYLGEILYVHYQTYTIVRNMVWPDLYILYQYAEQLELQSKKVKSDIPELKGVSINDAFTKIILFVMADPYHLSQAQQQQLHEMLHREVQDIELSPIEASTANDQSVVVIDLGQAKPPPHSITSEHQTLLRAFNSHHFIQKMSNALNQNNGHQAFNQEVSNQRITDFLSRPLIYWHKIQSGSDLRHTNRIFNNRPVRVVIGLHDIHHYVVSRSNKSQIAEEDVPIEKNSADITAALLTNDYSNNLLEIVGDDDTPNWLANNKTMAPPPNRASVILDESAKGCRLSWGSDETVMISVGRLIAISKEHDPSNSSLLIGRTRWLKQIGSQFQVGIEWLAPCVSDAILKSDTIKDQQALLLASYPQYTIVTTADMFNVGDQAELQIANEITPIRLIGMISRTELYAHFSYRSIESEKAEQQLASKSQKDIWQQL